MTVAEARAKWGEGRGVLVGLRRVVGFAGRVSRRQFLVLVLLWLVVGVGVVRGLVGDVAWLSGSGLSMTAFAVVEGAGLGARLVQWCMWVGVAGAVARRSRDAGWSVRVGVLLVVLVFLAPLLFLPVVVLVLGVAPAAGWVERWGWLLERGRKERLEARGRSRAAGGARRAAGGGSGADATLGSREEAREWLYGDEGMTG